jgi:hypothetical protein
MAPRAAARGRPPSVAAQHSVLAITTTIASLCWFAAASIAS